MSDIAASDVHQSPPSTVGDPEIREAARALTLKREQRREQQREPAPDQITKHDTDPDLKEHKRVSLDSEGGEVDEGVTARTAANAVAKAREATREQERLERKLWLDNQKLLEGDDAPQETAPVPSALANAEQPREPAPRPMPIAPLAAPETDEVRQSRQQTLREIDSGAEALAKNLPVAFPDVRWGTEFVQADAARLAQTDPARYALLMQVYAGADAMRNQHQRLTAAENQSASAQQQAYRDEQDLIVGQKVPELKRDARGNYLNPEKAAILKHKAVAYLQSRYSKEQIIAAYNDGILDNAATQLMIIQGIQHEEMREHAKALRAKLVRNPPVQRPGVSQPRTSATDERLQSLKHTAFKSNNPRDMANYLAARRRASER